MPRLFSKKTARPESSFSHSQILPASNFAVRTVDPLMTNLPFGAPVDQIAPTRPGSISPVSIFTDDPERKPNQLQPVTVSSPESPLAEAHNEDATEEDSYDLKPPPPAVSGHNLETLAGRLFSVDHLNLILRQSTLHHRFHAFLAQYQSSLLPTLTAYLETQKAVAAVEYANAVADHLHFNARHNPHPIAIVESKFHNRARDMAQDLITEALPAYVTHRLTRIVTESLVKEITGQGTPLTMIPSLAEVYCVTDPSLADNPIVYASEEFYNITQYGTDYVIGRNCRFLQGPRTSRPTVQRLIDALAAGHEVTETILNYRRDGTPFINLLLIAPLYNNKGVVRYFLGCQIDVSSLIEGGRGLESFEQLLSRDRSDSRFDSRTERNPSDVLSELGAMLSDEEAISVKSKAVRYSSTNGRSTPPQRRARMILGADDSENDQTMWPHPSLGRSGRLPGVYQNYLLVRPYPSLRITFTSPALRIPGLLQTKFLDRVGGPQHVREGILDALAHSTSVTAKISWLANAIETNEPSRPQSSGKPRWIHCTPLLGSDAKVGVWMIVMVEHEQITGQLNRVERGPSGLGSGSGLRSHRASGGSDQVKFTGNKLYQEYLRREGKSEGTSLPPSRDGSARSGQPYDTFKDF